MFRLSCDWFIIKVIELYLVSCHHHHDQLWKMINNLMFLLTRCHINVSNLQVYHIVYTWKTTETTTATK